MSSSPAPLPSGERLVSSTPEIYGERFQEHLLEQYKLYVDSAQRVSEKRITTGNFLLTVNSSLLTLFGAASTAADAGPWLVIVPFAGFLVSATWYSLVASYKDLNTAKFKVIHELEEHLPAALFRYEWHVCDHGKGKAYRPITHLERWIPAVFAAVFFLLCVYAFTRAPQKPEQPRPISVTGAVDVNVKSLPVAPPSPSVPAGQPQQRRSRAKK